MRSLNLLAYACLPYFCCVWPSLSPDDILNQLLDSIIHIVSFLALSQEFLQVGAAPIGASVSAHCADDLADQILEVLNFFG